jgi:hypothetical protein
MYPGCSTGFALKNGSATYTTMARHCTSHYKPYDLSSTKLYTTKFLTKDGAAKLLNATGSPLMFYGYYKSTLRATVVKDPTTGSGRNVNIGSYVCTSGGNSGTHCGGGANLKVKGSTGFNDETGNGLVSVLYADRVDGGLAAVSGDSGGPVYQNKTSTQVYAVGMIQANNKTLKAPCGSTRTTPQYCSSRVYYTSINTIIRSVPGYSLVTG